MSIPNYLQPVPGTQVYTGVKSVYGALGFWRASEYVWGFFKIASGCALSGAEPLFSVLGALRAVTPEHCFVR